MTPFTIDYRGNTKEQKETKTNIVYFTTKCNLGCTYCYEALDEVQGIDTNLEDLYNIVDEVIDREGLIDQSFFGIFGGEPTLSWNNVEKFMDYAYQKKKNVHFEMITNGIKFKDVDFIQRVYGNKHMIEGRLSISISFDGYNGNIDRIYRSGKPSTDDVIIALSNLTYLGLKYRIRYTIHKGNYKTIIQDIEDMLKYFNPLRIITSEVTEQFTQEDRQYIHQIYAELRNRWQNNEIQIPICELFCDMCTGCGITRGKFKYFVQDIEYEKDARSTEKFKHFENYKKDNK